MDRGQAQAIVGAVSPGWDDTDIRDTEHEINLVHLQGTSLQLQVQST